MRTNFSTEETQVYNLALDLARGDFSLHIDADKVSKKDLENHLRDKTVSYTHLTLPTKA